MMIADVHTHLDFEIFDEDRKEVINRAKEAGVKSIICNGVDPKTNRRILKLAKDFPIIKAAIGYYPCECDKISQEEFDKEFDFIKKNKKNIVAIGEVGLDKKNDNNFEKQKTCFKKVIELSKELDLPLIVHSRQAEKEAIELLEELEAKKVVMHCFSGKKSLVKKCIDNKWLFSIPCNVVRSEQFQEMVKMIPLRQLLTETDAPFLTHSPEVKRNEPKYIVESLKKISEIKGLDVEELSMIIFSNYQRLF